MGLFDKLLNRADSLVTHVQDAIGAVTHRWSAAEVEEKIREALFELVLHLAKQRPTPTIESRLRNSALAVVLGLAEQARQEDLQALEDLGEGDEAFEEMMEKAVERLVEEHPDLTPLGTALPRAQAKAVDTIADLLTQLRDLEHSSTTDETAREERRERLDQEYMAMAEQTDYSTLDKASLLGDIAKVMSVGRSIIQSAYDIPDLEAAIREEPKDPTGYVDLAEAIVRSRTAETIRKGMNVVLHPGTILVYGASQTFKGVKDTLPREIQLARMTLLLSQRLLAQDKTNILALAAAGRAYLILEEPESAAKYLKLAILLCPDCADFYYYLAQAMAMKDASEQAVSYLIHGTRLGSVRCAVTLYDTIQDFEIETDKSVPHSVELQERLEGVLENHEEDTEGSGILSQFLTEKHESMSRISKRIEQAVDELVLSDRKDTP